MGRHHIVPLVLVVVGLAALAAALVVILQQAVRRGPSDVERYETIKSSCETQYRADIERGVKYTQNPCGEAVLQQRFREQYGYDYK